MVQNSPLSKDKSKRKHDASFSDDTCNVTHQTIMISESDEEEEDVEVVEDDDNDERFNLPRK